VTTNHSPGTTILTGEQVTSSQAEIYSSVGQFQLIERLHLERCGTGELSAPPEGGRVYNGISIRVSVKQDPGTLAQQSGVVRSKA